MVMIWAAIMASNRSLLVPIDRGIKINVDYFLENILQGVLKLSAHKSFSRRPRMLEKEVFLLHSYQGLICTTAFRTERTGIRLIILVR